MGCQQSDWSLVQFCTAPLGRVVSKIACAIVKWNVIKPVDEFSDMASVINDKLVKLKWRKHISPKNTFSSNVVDFLCFLHQYVATMKISSCEANEWIPIIVNEALVTTLQGMASLKPTLHGWRQALSLLDHSCPVSTWITFHEHEVLKVISFAVSHIGALG